MISGSVVALVTPMAEDDSVDWDSLRALVEWHVEQGTNGIVAVGTSGESPTLDVEEHVEVIRVVVEAAAGRLLVIGGTGANSTREAIEWTQAAKDVDADACLLVAPYYSKPTQHGLYLHHRAVAEAVDIPQLLYNVPGRTACDLGADITLQLAQIPNIVGIKDATGDMERARTLIQGAPADFAVLSGDDFTALDLMLLGGQGNISVTANVAPAQMAALCTAALAGRADEARAVNEQLLALHRDLFLEANPIPVKWALAEMGRIPPGIRLPLTPLSEQYHEPVRLALRQAGLI